MLLYTHDAFFRTKIQTKNNATRQFAFGRFTASLVQLISLTDDCNISHMYQV